MDGVIFRQGTATARDIELHLAACSADFSPPLDSRVDLSVYAAKLHAAATTCEAWHDGALVGLIAYYRNDVTGVAFITSVSTTASFRRSGLARTLLGRVLAAVDDSDLSRIELEVDRDNTAALSLYRSAAFAEIQETGNVVRMARPSRAKE